MKTNKKEVPTAAAGKGTLYEILETADASGFSDELKAHCRVHLLPLLRRVIPRGDGIELNFLTEPPRFEIRRRITEPASK